MRGRGNPVIFKSSELVRVGLRKRKRSDGLWLPLFVFVDNALLTYQERLISEGLSVAVFPYAMASSVAVSNENSDYREMQSQVLYPHNEGRIAGAIVFRIGSREADGSDFYVGLDSNFSHSFLTSGCRSFGQRFAMAGLASGGYRCAIYVVLHVGSLPYPPLR